jgi:hypothetical protein
MLLTLCILARACAAPPVGRARVAVEFYFNDSNLPYDKFLWTTQGLPTGQGWVSIALIASFKRMRDHLHRGIPWIAEALRKSDGLLEVDEKGEKVRRAKELKPPTDAFGRSAYVVRRPWFSALVKMREVLTASACAILLGSSRRASRTTALSFRPRWRPGLPSTARSTPSASA